MIKTPPHPVVDALNEQLRQLVAEACRHPCGSLERRKKLNSIVRIVLQSGKLWQEHKPGYQDALQQTWLYFCRNVCQCTTNTCDPYDPTRSNLITWLNGYLKRRLQDCRLEEQQRPVVLDFEHISHLSAESDIPPILEDTRIWAETDPDGELRQTHIKGHPTVTCQVLILRRLPPETPWETLATEFNLSSSTLANFYQRQCVLRLRKFGETQGYL